MRGCQQLAVTGKLSIAMIYDKQAPFEKNNWIVAKKYDAVDRYFYDKFKRLDVCALPIFIGTIISHLLFVYLMRYLQSSMCFTHLKAVNIF